MPHAAHPPREIPGATASLRSQGRPSPLPISLFGRQGTSAHHLVLASHASRPRDGEEAPRGKQRVGSRTLSSWGFHTLEEFTPCAVAPAGLRSRKNTRIQVGKETPK
jgi:hypothetical protein